VYINQEAAMLTIAAPADTSGFPQAKTIFAGLVPAKGASDVGKGNASAAPESVGTPGQPVPKPSAQFREISGGKVFQASVPENWKSLASKTAIKVVPENGYGQLKGQTVFSHGAEFGVVKASTRDLQQATNSWLNDVAQANPELRLNGQQQATRISQRTAIATPLVNPSPLGGKEQIVVYTTFLADGATMFYYLTVVPEKDAPTFGEAFKRIVDSIKLTDVK
jgi:hypothetical protein